MATIPLTIPDAQLDRVAEAFGWGATGGPREIALPGETRNQFIQRCIRTQIKSHVGAYERSKLNAAIVVPNLDVT